MIVWLASFPRSGNTYFRILLNRRFGAKSSVVYDVDGVATRLGDAFVGYEDRPDSYERMRQSETVHFIKTHRQHGEMVEACDRAICLVRDGRDALVSWARQRSEADTSRYRPILQEMIENDALRGTGSWGRNVLSWSAPACPARHVRFETLVAKPVATVAEAVGACVPAMRPVKDVATTPTFADLRAVDPLFFRRGVTGSYADEMPEDLQSLFLSRPENRAALTWLAASAPVEAEVPPISSDE